MLNEKNVRSLLPNLPCSKCGTAFKDDALKIVRQEDGLLVLKVKCSNCGKCFGMAYLGLEMQELDEAVGLMGEEEPINYNDVLYVHQCCQNLDQEWQRFISGRKI